MINFNFPDIRKAYLITNITKLLHSWDQQEQGTTDIFQNISLVKRPNILKLIKIDFKQNIDV